MRHYTQKRRKMKKATAAAIIASSLTSLAAEIPAPVPAESDIAEFMVSNMWVLIGGILVFIMHLGFATVESGLCRAKNCTNILFKNTMTPAIGFLTYAAAGFSLMYPGNSWIADGVFGFNGFGMGIPFTDSVSEAYSYNGKFTYWTDFFFQGMFAATAATIVSGAVAERIKLSAYLIFTVVYVTLVYPVLGSWGWGGGWLSAKMNFHDFAGSTFVHSVGGWAALAGVIMLGPRIGKFVNGKAMAIMGHNIPFAALGVFMLWLGWFGFNAGSALSANPNLISYVCCTTMFGACAGLSGAMLCGMILLRKSDFSMTLNGCLAGLVAITAGADCISPLMAAATGFIGGAAVVPAVLLFDRIKLDDPVGALSVHLVNGIWGTLAVGLFSFNESYTLIGQLTGILSVAAVSFPSALLIFYIIKRTAGLRVSKEEELRGLDIDEHGAEAYHGFQIFTNQ